MAKIVSVLAGLVCLTLGAAYAQAPPEATATALDEGRLDPSWFGGATGFRRTGPVDYLWVKPGFALEGHKVRFAPFGEVEILGVAAGTRGEKDRELARGLNPTMARDLAKVFRSEFGKRLAIVETGEDLRVEGRIADCAETKWRKGLTFQRIYALTVDIRIVSSATGETLVAIHHRTITTDWSQWAEELAEEAADEGFAKLYAKGRPSTK